MLFDTHIHTKFSFDSQMTVAEAEKKAKASGIGMIVTDHLDINYNDLFPGSYSDFSITDFHKEYDPKRSDTLLFGIECGMDPRTADKSKEFIDAGPLDYVIGSVHTIGDYDIYSKENFLAKDRDTFYRDYFKYILECLKTHPFVDSLGHIDYPSRYSPYKIKGFRFSEFPDEMNEVFKFLAEEGKALELNLVRFRQGIFIEEFMENYSAFKKAGGKFVTIGSDSHGPVYIGESIEDAAKFIESIGLDPVYFKNRKIIFS
ncbi:MAG: histidinol-phosphatase HisJ family protein [Clostridiaceae bacterium]